MSKITQSDSFKKIFNRKIILGALTIVIAAIFIGITSFVPFIIKPENIGTAQFWTDELIIVAITILSLFSAMFIGQASNAQNSQSNIAKAKVRFIESLKLIVSRNAFCQWVKKVLQPNDIQAIKERELRRIGIDDYTILKLEDAQIKELANNPQKYNDRYYSQLDKKKVDYILSLKDGAKRVKLVEPGYYLTVSSIDSDRTVSEKSGREQKVKGIRLVVSVLSKIVLTLVPAMIFAMFVKETVEGAGDGQAAEAAARFVSRMLALVSSAFFGYMVGCQMNDIDADYINLKSDVHSEFIEDKNFVPVDQQELAKQEYIERVKRETQNLIEYKE